MGIRQKTTRDEVGLAAMFDECLVADLFDDLVARGNHRFHKIGKGAGTR